MAPAQGGACFDGFCLVSSDSDFIRLASRIREEGKRVYGFGEKKTPRPFVVACDKFIYTDVLAAVRETDDTAKGKSSKELRSDTRLVSLLRTAIEAVSDDDGWAHLGPVGHHIANQAPDFDPRNYGFKKLSELVVGIGLFEVSRKSKNVVLRDNRKK